MKFDLEVDVTANFVLKDPECIAAIQHSVIALRDSARLYVLLSSLSADWEPSLWVVFIDSMLNIQLNKQVVQGVFFL